MAHSHYSGRNYQVSYWRTSSGIEVDFILGEHEVALEVKGVPEVQPHHLKGLKTFHDEYKPKKSIIISLDQKHRITETIDILPIKDFLEYLWTGKII